MDIASIDVIDMLESLGIRNISVVGSNRGLQANYSCPFPDHRRGDQNPSAAMSLKTTAFKCWSCGAQGNAITFLAELEGCSPLLAARWLRERYENGFKESASSLLDELEAILRPKRTASEEVVQPLPEVFLQERATDWSAAEEAWRSGVRVPGWVSYAFMRGFSAEILDRHEFGCDPLTGRLCFALRDHIGRLIGFKARTHVLDEQPRYRVLGDREGGPVRYGFPLPALAGLVYGLHSADLGSGALVLVEGELNAVALRQEGIANAVGLPGSYLSDQQLKLLRSYCERLVLLLDADEAGEIALYGSRWRQGIGTRLSAVMPTAVVDGGGFDPAQLRDGDYWRERIAAARSFQLLELERLLHL